jgi:hypothetical protein
MFTRIRATWLASASAVALVLMFTGLAAGAVVLKDSGTTTSTAEAPATDTTATFEDVNGNGIDDDCEDGEVADAAAVGAALEAIDANADGVISVSEAAHSERVGGKNCNHGGYVSGVAGGTDEPTTEEPTADEPTTDCVEVAPPERDPALDAQKNGHGKWVSTVAQSGAIGGKNCNHGGAVSEAAKKDHAAAKAAKDAAKAERAAAKAAAKQARGNSHQH